MKISTEQAHSLKCFLCFNIHCDKCPFVGGKIVNGLHFCRQDRYFMEVSEDIGDMFEVDNRLFNLVLSNKEYFNKCREVNGNLWPEVRNIFYGAELK